MPSVTCPKCRAQATAASPVLPTLCESCQSVVYSGWAEYDTAPLAKSPALLSRPETARPRSARPIVLLGLVLLAGFLLPKMTPQRGKLRVSFPSISELADGYSTAAVRLLYLYPALAGLAVVCLAAARGTGRAVALLALGALPLLILMASEDAQEALEPVATRMGTSVGLALVLWMVSFGGIVAASRAVSLGRKGRAASALGGAAGVIYLASLLLPVLPAEMGKIGLLVPFSAAAGGAFFVPGLAAFVAMACMIAAAVLCIVHAGARRLDPDHAAWAFGLLVAALAALILGSFAELLAPAEPGWQDRLMPEALAVAKAVCWLLGLFLLAPVGLTDLLLSLPPPRPGPERAAVPTAVAVDAEQATNEKFAKLKALLDSGLITQADYERKKEQLLAEL